MRGHFIVLEGVDGSGKTTQAGSLCSWLSEQGREVEHFREPGGTVLGEKLRDLLLAHPREPWDPHAEAMMFFTARSELLHTRVGPALRDGRDVVCERFTPSTLAYQGQRPEVAKFILQLDELVVTEAGQPDLVILLDLPPEVSLARATSHDQPDNFEARGLAFQQAVRKGYQRYAEERAERCVILDVQDQLPDQVATRIHELVSKRLLQAKNV